METILTVLSTIGVGALAYAFSGVIRLSRRVDDLELIRMEMIDQNDNLQVQLESMSRDNDQQFSEIHRRFSDDVSSMDRRFDKVWCEIHMLDNVVNPNKDLVK